MAYIKEITCSLHSAGGTSSKNAPSITIESVSRGGTEIIRLRCETGTAIPADPDNTFGLNVKTALRPQKITAFYMLNDWWTRPAFIDSFRDIPGRTQVLLIRDETSCRCILAVPGSDYRSEFEAGTDHSFQVRVFSGIGTVTDLDEPVFIIAEDSSPRAAAEKAMRAMAAIHDLPLREARPLPEMLSHLGWCSWDAFYRDVDAAGLKAKAKELADKDIPAKWFLIDDGWLSTKGKKLKDLRPDHTKFPQGFAPVINTIRKTSPVEWFGVWHAVCGYWEGLADDNTLGCDEYLYRTGNGSLYPSPFNGEMFYRRWYEYLKQEGISFVKVDGQSSVARFFKNNVSAVASAKGITAAFESASEIMDYNVINCMGMAMESIAARHITGVSRNSNDFVPARGIAGFREHLLQNAYNSLYHNVLYTCDWDMFWTKENDAPKHALLRSCSGGPVYISDRVDETDPEVIRPMVYKDGKLPLLERSLLPADDCVFTDPLKSGCLKLHTYGKQAEFNTGVMLIFNLTEGPQAWSFSAADISELDPAKQYIAYDWLNGTFLPPAETYSGILEKDQYRLFVLVPVQRHMASAGRIDLYAGSTAVKTWEQDEGRDRLILREKGPFGWYSKNAPSRVFADQEDMTASVRKEDDQYLLPLDVESGECEIIIEW